MIHYRRGMKYQLARDYMRRTPICPDDDIVTKWWTLTRSGLLLLKDGYAWDGASGPTFDTESSISSSAEHDALCKMLRNRSLDYDKWQDKVNEFFRERCEENGMNPLRARIWHAGVEFGDAGNPNQGPDDEILQAP